MYVISCHLRSPVEHLINLAPFYDESTLPSAAKDSSPYFSGQDAANIGNLSTAGDLVISLFPSALLPSDPHRFAIPNLPMGTWASCL